MVTNLWNIKIRKLHWYARSLLAHSIFRSLLDVWDRFPQGNGLKLDPIYGWNKNFTNVTFTVRSWRRLKISVVGIPTAEWTQPLVSLAGALILPSTHSSERFSFSCLRFQRLLFEFCFIDREQISNYLFLYALLLVRIVS